MEVILVCEKFVRATSSVAKICVYDIENEGSLVALSAQQL